MVILAREDSMSAVVQQLRYFLCVITLCGYLYSDELVCSDDFFMYHNHLPCVAGGLKWNGYDHCGDGSDENDCSNVSSCLESVKNFILAPVITFF